MKERILDYIKKNPGCDGIGTAISCKVGIATTYKIINEPEEDGIIRKENIGMSIRLYVLSEEQ